MITKLQGRDRQRESLRDSGTEREREREREGERDKNPQELEPTSSPGGGGRGGGEPPRENLSQQKRLSLFQFYICLPPPSPSRI